MNIIGYVDRLSLRPGQVVEAKFSTTAETFTASLVRLYNGDPHPAGPGVDIRPVPTELDGQTFTGRFQPLPQGSCVDLGPSPLPDDLRVLRLRFAARPTLVDAGHEQTLAALTQHGATVAALRIDLRGDLVLTTATGDTPIGLARQDLWAHVELDVDVRGTVRLAVTDALGAAVAVSARATLDPAVPLGVHFGASVTADGTHAAFYNGRIDSPVLTADTATVAGTVLAAWDFGPGSTAARVIGNRAGPSFTGRSTNFPLRACIGAAGTPRHNDPRLSPEGYNAIHFHDDDLDDARWATDVALTLPRQLPSGVYGIKVVASDGTEDVVPLAVTPASGATRASVVVVLPTWSYLAYSCEKVMSTEVARDYLSAIGVREVPHFGGNRHDAYLAENRLHSLYDVHSDLSGVCFTSTRKPLPNVRHDHRWAAIAGGDTSAHQFSADLHLIAWLEQQGIEHDVITDDEIHRGGVSALNPYRVVITGSHPEYPSFEILDAYREYSETGGRLMYLGGNGFYWVTSLDPEEGHTLEVRKTAGICAWQPEPGEWHHLTTGEFGGLWRHRGFPPQRLLGVGMTAQGWDGNRPYTITADRTDPRVAWVFEGIDPSVTAIGDFESMVNGTGAAGIEIDRVDHALGTPQDTIMLGTATDFNRTYGLDVVQLMLPDGQYDGTTSPRVRSDLVLVPKPKQGAVFSTGSIAYCGQLLVNGGDNPVSHLTGNVLRTFRTAPVLPFGRD